MYAQATRNPGGPWLAKKGDYVLRSINEGDVKSIALARFEGLGYQVRIGAEIGSDAPVAERADLP